MILYKYKQIEELNIFYRQAGSPKNPTIVLFHGFPSSSHMYNSLIPKLEEKFYIIAPDYPGFGHSECLDPEQFEYTFDHLAQVMESFLEALDIRRFSFYVHSYGASLGFRIAKNHPDWIESLIIQNGNAYEVGLMDTWKPMKLLNFM